MLSEKTCRALAEKYPEVRDHSFVEGDCYWASTTGSMSRRIAVENAGEWRETWLGEPVGKNARQLWCPRLSDLLQIADIIPVERYRPETVLACTLDENGDRRWMFNHGPSGEVIVEDGVSWRKAGLGDTPEEAVAAWLLEKADS